MNLGLHDEECGREAVTKAVLIELSVYLTIARMSWVHQFSVVVNPNYCHSNIQFHSLAQPNVNQSEIYSRLWRRLRQTHQE